MANLTGKVIPVEIEDEVQRSYLNYAMSVIVSRALPDVRDGLKPVHRRILFAMEEMGLRHDRPFKKCGRIVGDVLGKYHPHGDQSIYEALVRLAQDFSLRYPLVRGQGNFGSVDGDPPAAMRYTEAKLSKISDLMINDIDKETVDFVPNYDDSLKEPAILPAAIPNLLVNGSSGIAVGMATNMVPHNLAEVCDGIVAFIDNPEISVDELLGFIKGPDFPTGGIVQNRGGYGLAARSGKGTISIRSKYVVEEGLNDKISLVFTEIPYMVNKAETIAKIAELVKEKKIDGISDLRDESDREGLRIVIEIKKGFDYNIVLNSLFSLTNLRVNLSINNLALVNGRPKVLSLIELIKAYVEHRKEVVTKRSKYELRKAEEKAHILEGLKIALDNIDEVIKTIKESENIPEAKIKLENRFKLSSIQSQAILDMRLQKLTSLETYKIIEELKEVLAYIEFLKDLLTHEEKIYKVIKEETLKLKNDFGDARKTEISEEEAQTQEEESFIQKEDVVITISKKGYIKRVSVSEYKSQGRGGKGVFAASLKDEDFLEHIFICSTHDYLLFITNKGRAHSVKAYKIPVGNRVSKGKHLAGIISLDENEHMTTIVSLTSFSEDTYMVMASKSGRIFRISADQFAYSVFRGINVVNLKENDSLVSAYITNGSDDLLLITRNGYCLKFKEDQLRATGKNVQGVRGISFKSEDDELLCALPVKEHEQLLLISENGMGKRLDPDDIKPHNRATQGVICYKPDERTGNLAGALPVSKDFDIMCITEKGKSIKCSIQHISEQGRTAKGVRVINIEPDDKVSGIAKSVKEDVAIQGELFPDSEKL